MSHSCFILSSTNGHLGCFYISVIVNNAVMNRGVLMSFKLVFWVSLDKFPEVGLLGYKAVPCLIFWGISILLSPVAAPVCIPTDSGQRFPFSTSSPTLLICWLIDDSHSDQCEVISYCGFNLYSSDD